MAAPNPAAQQIIGALANRPKLLMKRRILSFGDYYDVKDEGKNDNCTVGFDAKQNHKGALVGAAVGAAVSQVLPGGDIVGRWAERRRQYTYTVKDPRGNLAMEVRKGPGGYKAQFDIVDAATRGNFGCIKMKRGLFGGMRAEWFGPGGQVLMQTKGNIIRRKYRILDGAAREVGRVRHKILAIRDVWQLELDSGGTHLYPAIFATVLDFEKMK